MIHALMWKEYREHRAVWLVLAAAGGAGLYGLSQLMAPGGFLGSRDAHYSLRATAVLFAWTYGMVCGAMLLANEVEAGTITFLDMLPVRRKELWLVKCLFGLLLLGAQVAVLTGLVIGLGIVETRLQFLATLLGMLYFGLLGLSWGLLFSARGENVLNVIGLAFLGQIVGAFVMTILGFILVGIVLVVLSAFGGNRRDEWEISLFTVNSLGVLGMIAVPLAGSARLFTQLDRQRLRRVPRGTKSKAALPTSSSWGRLLWLNHTQMRRLRLVLSIFALGLGFALPAMGPLGWPILTLLIGLLCGVTVWTDEQVSGSFRFLGDQRLPLGRVWITKVGTRLALAVFAAFLLLLPSLILTGIHREQAISRDQLVPFFADLLHCGLVGPIVPAGVHLSLWLLYGFTIGQLCGMLFRKTLVAAVVSVGAVGTLVCLWVPSLLGMGLHFWQIAGVPLALLAASWIVMPAWTADRLLTRGTLVRLGEALLAAGVWTGVALWYRIAEIPDMPDPFNVPEFVARIPPMDKGKNDAGLAIRAAWGQVERMSREMHETRTGKPLFPQLHVGGNVFTFSAEIGAVLGRGWPNRPSALGDWLDQQFEEEWYARLKEVADFPLGMVENPKQMTFDDGLHKWHNLADLNQLLAVRGLQRQANGDPRTFVDNLRVSLALSRNLQHLAPPIVVLIGRQAEFIGIQSALHSWLEKLSGHPELLERVRDILLEHEAQLPDGSDAAKVSYLIARNSLDFVPDKLIAMEIQDAANRNRTDRAEIREKEIETAALFWRIPWEYERHQRILRLAFQANDDPRQLRQVVELGGRVPINLTFTGLRPRNRRDIAFLRAVNSRLPCGCTRQRTAASRRRP